MRWRATWMPPRAGYLPLDDGAGGRQRLRPGEADTLELVPLARRDGVGEGAPQDAVLGEDVHDLAVEADPGPLAGQRGADLDDPVAQGDDPGGVDQPVNFHAAGRGERSGGRAGWWRSCWPGASSAQPGQVNRRQPGWHGLDPPPPMLMWTVVVSIHT